MKFNVHGGHNRIATGAAAYLNEVTEDRKVKDAVISLLKSNGNTAYDCTDDVGRTPSACLSNIVKKCNAHKVDLDVSIHFNAANKDTGNGKVKGTEVFIYSSSSKAKAAANRICKNMEKLGFTNRGVKTSSSLYVLKRTSSPALLIEVCFVDDADDYKLYRKVGVDKVAKAIAEGLTGTTIKQNETDSKETEKPSTSKKLQAKSLKGMDARDVIKKVAPLFAADQKKTGILASVSLAQFILESGYGQSELAQNANNCFGMKTNLSGNTWKGSAWDGKSKYRKRTGEEGKNGNHYTIVADFRKYPSIEESISDHSAYLLGAMNGNKKRYAGLSGCTDYKKAIQIIKNGDYATSSDYVENVCNLIEEYNLTQYDVAFTPYKVKTKVPDLNIRKTPTVDGKSIGYTGLTTLTIVAEKTGKISKSGKTGKWGLLKSHQTKKDGWICLAFDEYVKKI